LLDFLNALRLQVKVRQTLLAGGSARPLAARSRAWARGNVGRGAIRRLRRSRSGGCVWSGSFCGRMRRARVESRGLPSNAVRRLRGGSCLLRHRVGGRGVVGRNRRWGRNRLGLAGRGRALCGTYTARRQADARQQNKQSLAGFLAGRNQTAPFLSLRQAISQE
jgi:hypothetical protein